MAEMSAGGVSFRRHAPALPGSAGGDGFKYFPASFSPRTLGFSRIRDGRLFILVSLCLNERMNGKTSGGQRLAAPPGAAAWICALAGRLCRLYFMPRTQAFSERVSVFARPHPGPLPQYPPSSRGAGLWRTRRENRRQPQFATTVASGSGDSTRERFFLRTLILIPSKNQPNHGVPP